MVTLKICVGSSCHLKGSYDIIERFQALKEENGIGDELSIEASFCMGNCVKGVCVSINDEVHGGVTPSNVPEFFEAQILPLLEK
ncbi:(2Fe-2S) ferredoxin domain-containing protein [Candidatus Soleaferrea massiliensis]|uniref:(2Fe-2S) ferredoxin domain-containing protein n=1 Tax=Candidatus Soleaferrea massiliensis TaxID=1470354 RepID=UPI00058FA776|nr:NAD(P)H-dependent oxidoreductase subunit E [Candidatus Soleaferrea massiliensis]